MSRERSQHMADIELYTRKGFKIMPSTRLRI